MIKIVICDDETLMCDILTQKITYQMNRLNKSFRICCYNSPNDLLKSTLEFDILLLDIQMPEFNGIELAKQLRRLGNSCSLIFITVLFECVFDAFEVEAIDYICKPVDDIKLEKALTRAIKHLASKAKAEKCLSIQTMNWYKSIKLSSIYYCEIINRKIHLHTTSGIIEYYSKLEEVEKLLDYRFIKCHRSYLVNLDYLAEYKDSQIILENGDHIPVSRLRRREVINILMQYLKKED